MASRRTVGGQTYLASRPELWRRLFPLDTQRATFIAATVGRNGRRVLDVGCATGELCDALSLCGQLPTGVDLNPWFIRAAKVSFPDAAFQVADMRSLPFRGRFDSVVCIGSTLLYAASNADLERTLRSFRAALRPGGRLLLDVLNASALIARRPFLRRTVHRFPKQGLTATIRHAVDEAAQVLTESVTWTAGGRHYQDPESRLRLLFPLELTQFLAAAEFDQIRILGGFRAGTIHLKGRRMIAIARRA